MPILFKSQYEAFAQALARGLSEMGANVEAGYADTSSTRARERAARPEIIARTAEIRLLTAWGGDTDLAAVFEELMRLAGKTGKSDQPLSAAILAAARGLLAEAAKLRMQLPPGVGATAPPIARTGPILPPQMSTEEWMEAFAPKR